MQVEHKQPVSFKGKITPTEVKEEPDKKTKVELEKKSAPEKTLPSPSEKKQKKNVAKERTKETVSFPVDSRINAYGFIHMKVGWLVALGWRVDMALKIDKNQDGSVTIRKA